MAPSTCSSSSSSSSPVLQVQLPRTWWMLLSHLHNLRDDFINATHGADGWRIVERIRDNFAIDNSVQFCYVIYVEISKDKTLITWCAPFKLDSSQFRYPAFNILYGFCFVVLIRRWVRIRQGELSYYKPDDDNQQALNILQLSDDVTIIKKLNFNSFSIETRKKVY